MFENQIVHLEEIPAYEQVQLNALQKDYQKIVVFDCCLTVLLGAAISTALYFIADQKTVYTYFFVPTIISLFTAYIQA